MEYVLAAIKPFYETAMEVFMEELEVKSYKLLWSNPYWAELNALNDAMNILRNQADIETVDLIHEIRMKQRDCYKKRTEGKELYYISHPYTSFGNPNENLIKAMDIEIELHTKYDFPTVNPILTLPKGLEDELAMKKCFFLLESCDAIIMCPNWKKSKGCMQEYRWAVESKKPIYEYDGENLYVSELAEFITGENRLAVI